MCPAWQRSKALAVIPTFFPSFILISQHPITHMCYILGMEFEPLAVRAHEKMKDVLMHPEAVGPAVHYYMIRGGSEKRNITIWESGTVGGLSAAPGRPAQAG